MPTRCLASLDMTGSTASVLCRLPKLLPEAPPAAVQKRPATPWSTGSRRSPSKLSEGPGYLDVAISALRALGRPDLHICKIL